MLLNKELQLKQILFTILLISLTQKELEYPQTTSASISNKFLTVEEEKQKLQNLLSIFQKQVRRFQETKYLEEAVHNSVPFRKVRKSRRCTKTYF